MDPQDSKPQVSRRHHYVPAFWLAGFTPTGAKEGRIVVVEKHTGRTFRAKPTTAGFEKDLFTVEHPELEPDAIERAFGEAEGKIAPALRRLISGSSDPRDLAIVLNLVALLAVRVPSVRRVLSGAVEEIASRLTDMTLSERGRAAYEEFVRSSGSEPGQAVTFDQLRAAWAKGGFRPVADPTFITMQTVEIAAELYEWLALRQWAVIEADQWNSGTLIGCDRPVCLYWTKKPPGFIRPPGFSAPSTEVLLALDRRHLLVGYWGEHRLGERMGRTAVANANAWAIIMADRHLFSPSGWFVAGRFGDEIKSSTSLFKEWSAGNSAPPASEAPDGGR